MKLKIKLGEIEQILMSMKSLVEKELPVLISYKISKLVIGLDNEFAVFNSTRFSLTEKYGKKKEDGELDVNEKGMATILPEKMKEFNSEFGVLTNQEIEIEFEPISIQDLDDIKIPAKDLIFIREFLKD